MSIKSKYATLGHRLNRKTFFFVFLLLTVVISAAGQDFHFKLYTSKDGLAGFNTSHLTQDEQGFIWLLSDGQLQRFNGHGFLSYPLPAGKTDPLTGLEVVQDSLLFLLAEKTAFLFNPVSDTWKELQLPSMDEPPFSFSLLGQKGVYLEGRDACEERWYWQWKDGRFHPLGRVSAPDPDLRLVRFDSQGKGYFFNEEGMRVIRPSGVQEKHYRWPDTCRPCQPADAHFDPEGALVILAGNAFFRLERGADTIRASASLPPSPATEGATPGRFILEPDGSLWSCGRDGLTFFYYDASRDTLFDFHEKLKQLLPAAFFFDGFDGLFMDRNGTVWAESDLGLLKISRRAYPFDIYFSGEKKLDVNPSLSEGRNGMVFLSSQSGLALINPEEKKQYGPYSFAALPDRPFFGSDSIWQWDGTFLNLKTRQLEKIRGTVNYEDHSYFVGVFARGEDGRSW